MGCVTAMGNDVDVFYEKLLNGESSITPITEWDAHEDMATTIAGEIKGFDPEEFMTKKMARRVDPFIAYQVRSIHWFPYDRVGVVNADP
jgi:3-oxoacyl-[acyl-carrier-protein] synthase II